jgi:hypothetical protein
LSDPEGWIRVVDDCAATELLQTLDDRVGPCRAQTPLADSICALQTGRPSPTMTEGSGKLMLLTDGGENASVGICSGPDGTRTDQYFFLYEGSSWESRTVGQLLRGSLPNWALSTTLFEPPGGTDGIDPETGRTVALGPLVALFPVLKNITFGSFTAVPDDQPLNDFVMR